MLNGQFLITIKRCNLQIVFTPYGQLKWSAYRTVVTDVLEAWLNLSSQNAVKKKVPLSEYLKDGTNASLQIAANTWIRYLNDGIDTRRNELFEDYLDRKYAHHQLKSLSEYDDWKESYDAKTKSQSQFVRDRLMRNVDMFSNGQSAMKYFTDRISEDALYFLDEPENSLSIELQQELCEYLQASARHFGCQFVIATHSPVLLSLKDALIYDLDSNPVQTRKWTELENVRRYFDFFEKHRDLFLEASGR